MVDEGMPIDLTLPQLLPLIIYVYSFIFILARNIYQSIYCLQKFVSIMGKPPITILTDQDPWLTEAIGLELPSTKHSFCIWHITSKFSGWFL